MATNIFDYITEQENLYKTNRIPLTDGWEWNMYDHVRKSFMYKNSKYTTGNDDGTRPYKNIILPIAKLAYRSEGFDVKDIELYVNNPELYYKSFVLKKYHYRWSQKKHIDRFIDTVVTTSFDYGGVLTKKTRDTIEVIPFQQLAFCDQTDIMSGAIGEKHMYSIEDLQDMKGVWDTEAIEEAIEYSTDDRANTQLMGDTKAKTPGKYVEVYEVHGMFPETWLNDDEGETYLDASKYSRQMWVVVKNIKGDNGDKKGLVLFKAPEREVRYKFMGRGGPAEKIHGRALNRGGIEELFEPQVWVNYSEIQLKEMMDVASLMILNTQDASFGTKNNIKDLSQGEILSSDAPVTQVNLQPINETSFYNNINAWEALARATGSASESSLAVTPTAGTPFALEQLKTQNGLQEHDYQRGIIADFIGEIYQDWVIPMMSKDIVKGDKWMDEMSLEEMQYVAEHVVDNEFNSRLKQALIDGKLPTAEEVQSFKKLAKDIFMKDNKKFIEIFKDEMKSLPMDIRINVAGKQSYLAQMTDKLSNVFRQVISNPQVLQIPAFAKIFNEILESSGISPVDFSTMPEKLPTQPTEEPAPVAV